MVDVAVHNISINAKMCTMYTAVTHKTQICNPLLHLTCNLFPNNNINFTKLFPFFMYMYYYRLALVKNVRK